jgi:hypothetical protein
MDMYKQWSRVEYNVITVSLNFHIKVQSVLHLILYILSWTKGFCNLQ